MQNVSTPLSVSERDDTLWLARWWGGKGKAVKLTVFASVPWLLYMRWQPSGLVRLMSGDLLLATFRNMLNARFALRAFIDACGGRAKLLRSMGVR